MTPNKNASATCKIVALLKEVVAGHSDTDKMLSAAARNALAVIHDMQDYEITKVSLDTFMLIAEEVFRERGLSFAEYVVTGDPDCPICAAMRTRKKRGH
jgi:hypothetical protein